MVKLSNRLEIIYIFKKKFYIEFIKDIKIENEDKKIGKIEKIIDDELKDLSV